MKLENKIQIAQIGIGVIGLYLAYRLIPKDPARAAVNAAGDIAVDVVKGVGDVFGVPDPASQQARIACAEAKARGDGWAVSLNCPALEWGDYVQTSRDGTSSFGTWMYELFNRNELPPPPAKPVARPAQTPDPFRYYPRG